MTHRYVTRAALPALLLLGVACFKPEPRVITRVALKVMAPAGGATFVEYDSTGKVTRGQMSAGRQPTMLAHDSATIPLADAAGIFAAARGLGELLEQERRPPPEPAGSTVIGVLFNDGTQARYVWPQGSEHPDPRVRALADKLMAHRIGS